MLWIFLIIILSQYLQPTCQRQLNREARIVSNFNLQKSSQSSHSYIRQEQPLSLPIILTNPGEYKSNRPLFQKYSLRKYQLYDTNYLPDLSKISRLDEELAYNMEPPLGVFEESSKIIIENYRLLEMKDFKITLINPSEKYRFCVEEIFIDSEEITRQQKRPLPFCLNGSTKYPFFFSLYITEHKPLIFKGTVYFILTIYDGNELVDEKIWPKQIIVKVTHNHLRIIPLEIRNCNKNNSIVMIRNPQKWDLSLVIIYKRKLYELTGQPIDGNIVIPAQKSYKLIIDGKDSKMTIYTKSIANSDIIYPVLYVPIYCIQDLIVDYFNIGILSDDRSLLQFPVTVSSYTNSTIYIQEISLKSSTQTVQLLALRENHYKNYLVQPNAKHYIIARIVIHGSRKNVQREYFEVSIKYMTEEKYSKSSEMNSANKQSSSAYKEQHQKEFQIRQTRTTFHYCEMRSPISVGSKRFIDISRLNENNNNNNNANGHNNIMSENAFPIRNNLNLPINLIRVIYDESKFKLLWLQDKRDYIFPNHQRDEFSLQYIGSRNLQISPVKYVALLEFNGNLFIPLEIVIYDRTLQCVYYDKTSKCADLQTIQFGYFNQRFIQPVKTNKNTSNSQQQQSQNQQEQFSNRNFFFQHPSKKLKKITIRNWSPQSKNIKVGVELNSVEKFGFNCTVRIIGPFPEYDLTVRSDGNIHELYLKGNHYIIAQIELQPLDNATSGTLPFRIITPEQHITKPIKFKIQNGTIALIPQISRFQSAFKKTIQYINLVSTFKQSYRISEIKTNLSNLMVYCNNHSEIYENQWIGMAVIYQPFLNEWNITQECCGMGFLTQIMPMLLTPNKPIVAQITLRTTTQLQTNATILINSPSPPLIQLPFSHQFSFREKFRKDSQRIDINLIDDGGKNIEKFQYKLKVRNIFQETLKGNVVMIDQELIQRLGEYMEYQHILHKKVVANFCLRNDVKVKHNFTPTIIKNLFQLQSLPIQITVQPLTNTSFYINSPIPPRQEVIQSKYFTEYFKETINSGSRMCYRFETSYYMKNLIQTGVINWFSEEYRFEILSQFMRREFEQLESLLINADREGNTDNNYLSSQGSSSFSSNFNSQLTKRSSKYNLQYEDFYAQYSIDKQHFCKGDRNINKMTALFRFCQHINIKMNYQSEYKQQKTFIKYQECMNTSSHSNQNMRRECKMRENGKKMRRVYEREVNKYFLLHSDKYEEGKNSAIELGFEIYPIKNKAPLLRFFSNYHQTTSKTLVDTPNSKPSRKSNPSNNIDTPSNNNKNSASLQQPEHYQPDNKKDNNNFSYQKPTTNTYHSIQQQQPQFLTNPSFYLILLNNYTSYQLYHQTIQISKPKLRLKNIIINNHVISKQQLQAHYLIKDQDYKALDPAKRSRVLPVYVTEDELRIKEKSKEISSSSQSQTNSMKLGEKDFSSSLKDIKEETERRINEGDLESLYIEGEKIFQLSNDGLAGISYTHIGFENQQRSCSYNGINVIVGPCSLSILQQKPENKATYKIHPKQSYRLTISYSIPLLQLISSSSQKSKNMNMMPSLYFYNRQTYHINFLIKFSFNQQLLPIIGKVKQKSLSMRNQQKIKKNSFLLSNVWNIGLNIMAFVFIVVVIVMFKQDEIREQSSKLLRERGQLGERLIYTKNDTRFDYNNGNRVFRRPRSNSKSQHEWTNTNQSQPYHIIDPFFYPATIGTAISNNINTKSYSSYHPIVSVSQQLLQKIKQQQLKQMKSKSTMILHNYFNQSQESEIMMKGVHQMSLTINLQDEEDDKKGEKHHHIYHGNNESISQESSFDFELRKSQNIQIQDLKEKNNIMSSNSNEDDFSQASARSQESDFPEGQQVQVTQQIFNDSNTKFGFESDTKKVKQKQKVSTKIEEKQDQGESYYNVFSSMNPLKKKEKGSPFSWMNENKKRSRLKW